MPPIKKVINRFEQVKNRFENIESILKQAAQNQSIEITRAVRNTKVDDIQIEVGDYIALVNGKIGHKAKDMGELISDIYKKYLNDYDRLN